MAHRYFTADITGDTARLSAADAAHLARVLRARPGQPLVMCDGAGHDYDAEILTANSQAVTCRLQAQR
ncbi:MAG: RNA methyltransferase PUA domain-containing protein, partial [Oscillospiraceae bacterium]